MHMPDVNVLIDAWHLDSHYHEPARDWLEQSVRAPTPLGLSDIVLSAAIRILTNTRIRGMAWPLDDVLVVANDLVASPGTRVVRPGRAHWNIFTELCRDMEASGNVVPDCFLAALAIENDATFVSRDTFFATVPGLDSIGVPATNP